MAKEITLFKSEEKMKTEDVATLLKKLAGKLEQNKLHLKKWDKAIQLDIPKTVELEIEVEKKVGKRKIEMELELEIKWVLGQSGKPKNKCKLELI